MSKLDDLIRDALDAKDQGILDKTGELGYFQLSLNLFKGKLGWVSWLIMIVQTALFLVGVWCAFKFFAATDMLLALKWGLSSATLIIVASALKFSLMPQMQADRIMREIKRVELLLASRG